MKIPDEPHMSDYEKIRFVSLLKASEYYLEYGSGSSTIFARDLGVPNIVSVESDKRWYKAVKKRIGNDEAHHILYVDIGKTNKWGTPKTDRNWSNYSQYALAPWLYYTDAEFSPNLILIDGRFRVACFLATLLFGKTDSDILFHDYKKRKNYQVIEKFIEPITMIDNMAYFKIPYDILVASNIWLDFIKAIKDHR
jgi:hypothetical protein